MSKFTGKLIAIEGCDGTGKTTTLNYVKKYAKASRMPVLFTKEPGGTEFGKRIRKFILNHDLDRRQQAWLFAAARQDHVRKVIAPALAVGTNVVCDRYLLSSLAYQSDYRPTLSFHNLLHHCHLTRYGKYDDLNHVREINNYAVKYQDHFFYPDVNIYLKLQPNIEISRLEKRKHIKFDQFDKNAEDFDKLQQLHHNYAIAISKSMSPVVLINATKPPKERAKQVLKVIKGCRRFNIDINSL